MYGLTYIPIWWFMMLGSTRLRPESHETSGSAACISRCFERILSKRNGGFEMQTSPHPHRFSGRFFVGGIVFGRGCDLMPKGAKVNGIILTWSKNHSSSILNPSYFFNTNEFKGFKVRCISWLRVFSWNDANYLGNLKETNPKPELRTSWWAFPY